MKQTAIITFTVLLFAVCAAAQSKADQEFLALQRAEDEAEVKRDVATLDKLLADDFIFVAANGSVIDKKKFLDEVKADTSPPSGEKLEYENFKARVYGKTAMINYTLVVSGKDKDKKDFVNRFQMSVLWIKQKGSWRMANFHATRVRT